MSPDTQERPVILRIQHLSKNFGKRKVLRDISFDTYAGEVFGFLGPNGAGKTTLIKLVVGHLLIDEGVILVDGNDIRSDYEKAMADMGAIVENPEFYKYMSGWDNLMQYAGLRGVSRERVAEVVHMVGMDKRIKDKVSKYSLGMRQRLGVALAIMGRPKLLILDEPTNGLDPAGIKELRDILKKYAHEENAAVFVSSHLMSEMELMCDRVGVIVNGELVDVKPIDELVSVTAADKADFVFEVDSADRALALLDFISDADKKKTSDCTFEVILTKNSAAEMLAKMNREIVQANIALYTVSPKENKRLEDVFIELTGVQGGDQIG